MKKSLPLIVLLLSSFFLFANTFGCTNCGTPRSKKEITWGLPADCNYDQKKGRLGYEGPVVHGLVRKEQCFSQSFIDNFYTISLPHGQLPTFTDYTSVIKKFEDRSYCSAKFC